jgi:hypothetical protein
MGGFSDGEWQFWNLEGVTRWNSQFSIHSSSHRHLCYFTIASLFVLDKVYGLE